MNTIIKALSLWQPWASLIALRDKEYETRGWETNWRGQLVIHAAKYQGEMNICRTSPFRECLIAGGITKPSEMPMGVALCVVDLVDCIPVEKLWGDLTTKEQAFGNYQAGRFAWKLANVRIFPTPIPCRGMQGLWAWTLPLPATEG